MTPKELQAYLNSDLPIAEWAERHPNLTSTPPMEQRLKGALTGHLQQICKNDSGRLNFLQAVFGVTSSKQLTDKQWASLFCFIDPQINQLNRKYEIRKEAAWDIRNLLYQLQLGIQSEVAK